MVSFTTGQLCGTANLLSSPNWTCCVLWAIAPVIVCIPNGAFGGVIPGKTQEIGPKGNCSGMLFKQGWKFCAGCVFSWKLDGVGKNPPPGGIEEIVLNSAIA